MTSRLKYLVCGCYYPPVVGCLLPYILVYKSNFLDVKMGSKNRPRPGDIGLSAHLIGNWKTKIN